MIWLNDDNAKMLNKELDKQQHTSIEELNKGGNAKLYTLQRFSRMEKLRVPPIDFFQLKVSYLTLVLEDELNTAKELQRDDFYSISDLQLICQQNLKGEIEEKSTEQLQDDEYDKPITFNNWLHLICKESFRTLHIVQLKNYTTALQAIFDTITDIRDGIHFLKGEYNQMQVRANVRKAFIPHRSIEVKEDVIPDTAELLQIKNFQSTIQVNDTSKCFPNQEQVLKIVDADKGKKLLKTEIQTTIDTLKALGNQDQTIQALLDNPDSYEPADNNINNKTYHYLPYKFDSSFEINYFSDSLQTIIHDKQLEFYFNGDDNLTDFKIRCYKKKGKTWRPLGNYTPDFLVINRNEQGTIKQILIIETKGEGFATKFAERRRFMEEEFVKLNNERFGYNRFSFLYIEDTMTPPEQDKKTITAINQFFK